MNFLKENNEFENCVKNVCVYCMNLQKWSPLKNKYPKVYDVCHKRKGVFDFIIKYSSNEIKPFPMTKLLTYQDYVDKYKDRHFKISQFYGNLTLDKYKENIENIKKLIKKEGEAERTRTI